MAQRKVSPVIVYEEDEKKLKFLADSLDLKIKDIVERMLIEDNKPSKKDLPASKEVTLHDMLHGFFKLDIALQNIFLEAVDQAKINPLVKDRLVERMKTY